jgi:hypothetical protein
MKWALHRRRLAVVALGIFAFVAGPSATANAQDKCLRRRLKAFADKEAGLLSCFARVAARGNARSLRTCLQKGQGKYAAAFTRSGACSGDREICECLAENCAIAVREALPDLGPSKCEAARLRAAGKVAAGKLRCNARANARGSPVDTDCIRKVEARYQSAFGRTTGCTGDQATVQTIANLRCVSDLGGDPTGGGTVSGLCTSHACDGADVRGRSTQGRRVAD